MSAAETKDLPSNAPGPDASRKSSPGWTLLKWMLFLLVAAVGVFAGVVAMQPSEFLISRSATMNAAPAAVFAQVNDFHNWEAWSPWAKLDPNAKDTFEGPASGEGAIFRWAGNDEVGEGSMTILESKPNERIRIKLAFIKPMEDSCDTEFTFQPEGQGTKVTWTMSGTHNFLGKAVCLVMNMDKMVGDKFEEGLASLRAVAERAPADAEGTPGSASAGAKISSTGGGTAVGARLGSGPIERGRL